MGEADGRFNLETEELTPFFQKNTQRNIPSRFHIYLGNWNKFGDFTFYSGLSYTKISFRVFIKHFKSVFFKILESITYLVSTIL